MGLSNGKATNKQMQEMVFSLKLQSKNLHRQAGKAEKDAKKEKLKIKKVSARCLRVLLPHVCVPAAGGGARCAS